MKTDMYVFLKFWIVIRVLRELDVYPVICEYRMKTWLIWFYCLASRVIANIVNRLMIKNDEISTPEKANIVLP